MWHTHYGRGIWGGPTLGCDWIINDGIFGNIRSIVGLLYTGHAGAHCQLEGKLMSSKKALITGGVEVLLSLFIHLSIVCCVVYRPTGLITDWFLWLKWYCQLPVLAIHTHVVTHTHGRLHPSRTNNNFRLFVKGYFRWHDNGLCLRPVDHWRRRNHR